MERTIKSMPSIDRLSSLPDKVICHILSFLPTKLSVATSVLARRWRFLWAHVSNIDFDGETSISNIINRVMLLHKAQSINTFRISSTCDFTEYQLETWIIIAKMRNVKNLDIYLGYRSRLPRCLFTCNTLVALRLGSCIGIPSTGIVCLPCLKKLHLYNLQLDGDEALPHLISGCPMLEELIIERIMDHKLVSCDIYSSTIKRLNVTFDQACGFGIWRSGCKLQINTHALRYLQLQLCLSNLISVGTLTSLIEADISFDNYYEMEEDHDYNISMLNFIDSLYNVKCLKLSFSNISFADQIKSIRRFDNLTKLEWAADWSFLLKFLESAENLEVLIIHEVDMRLNDWIEPNRVPTCLLSHVRSVRIDQFGCMEHEFSMLRYFLRNAKVLKRMEIFYQHYGIDFKAKSDAVQRISLFERGSEACKLAFY